MAESEKRLTYPPETYTDDEINRLLRATSLRAPTGIRNRALLVVGWRAGLRCAEALALYPKDVDLAEGSIRVLRGKGSKSRTVGLDPAACAIVQRWLQKRAALGLKSRQPLFCTLDGHPLQKAKDNLGHSSLAITGAYLAHIAPHERIQTARRREWNATGL